MEECEIKSAKVKIEIQGCQTVNRIMIWRDILIFSIDFRGEKFSHPFVNLLNIVNEQFQYSEFDTEAWKRFSAKFHATCAKIASLILEVTASNKMMIGILKWK